MMKIKLNERAGVTACLNPTPEIKYINVTRMVVVCCGGRGAFTLRIQRLPIDGLKISCSFLFLSFFVDCECVCVCVPFQDGLSLGCSQYTLLWMCPLHCYYLG